MRTSSLNLLKGLFHSSRNSVRNKRISCFFSILLVYTGSSFAQANRQKEVSKKGWTIHDPFSNEVFIQNMGQFDRAGIPTAIQCAVTNGGMEIYFSRSGFYYNLKNYRLKEDNEEGREEYREESEKEFHKKGNISTQLVEKHFKNESAQIGVEWIGANEQAEIILGDKIDAYYNYSIQTGRGSYLPVKANAYRKVTYKEIYKNMDVEFFFPEGKENGIKYNIIVHPGGNITDFKLKYSGFEKLFLDKKGNLQVLSRAGTTMEQAPVSFYTGDAGSTVASRYKVEGNVLGFELGSYDKSKTICIDPWVTNPAFTTINKGYGIRIDYKGNCYVYGGGTPGTGPNYTYEVKKFDPNGNLLWTFVTPEAENGYYGDIEVTRGGSVFIGSGFGFDNFAGMILKLDPAGQQTESMDVYTPPNGGAVFEVWKLNYNQKMNSPTLFIGGGGSTAYQLGKIDTSLTNPSAFNSFNSAKGLKDVVYIMQEEDGSSIYSTLSSNTIPAADPEDKRMIKVPSGAMMPAVWQNTDPSNFLEVGQSNFLNSSGAIFTQKTTGLNGMAVCEEHVYTYNGAVLTAWNKTTGSIVDKVNVPGGSFNWYSGIDKDHCCRVYVGVNGKIERYTSDLKPDTTFTVSGKVYDLRFDPQSYAKMYVAGDGFIQLIDVPDNVKYCPTCINISANNVNGCDLGSATATVTDPLANPPLSYQWSTIPAQYTQTANNLDSGTYVVVVKDSTPGCRLTWKDTVKITGIYTPTIVHVNSGKICAGNSIVLTASGATSYTWQPANTLSSSTGASVIATPPATTTYVVTGAINNCFGKDTAIVTVIPSPIAGFTANPPGGDYPLNVNFINTSSGASSYFWNFNGGNTSTVVSPSTIFNSPGNYQVMLVAYNSDSTCMDTVYFTILVEDQAIIEIPNIFSPNGDQLNDVFSIKNKGFKSLDIEIYNRWGRKITRYDINTTSWDGVMPGGNPAVEGTYFYIITGVSNKGDKISKEGNFLLIRG